jgi:hypothetical protein
VALNNHSGLSILCGLTDVLNMLRPHLTDAFALLFCLCTSPCPTNAQAPETHILPVTVVTADGTPVTNLQSRNLRVHDRGVQVKSLSLDTTPRRVVLLFDTGGGMRGSNGKVTLFQAAVHAASLFLDRVPSVDSISVHTFAEKDKEVVPLSHDIGAIRMAITNLPGAGSEEDKKVYGLRTDLDNALNSILTVLSEHSQFGDTIVIFSDGLFPRSGEGDILSYYDQPEYLRRITPRLGVLGVRVFFSLAGNVQGAPPLNGIEQFIRATGGESFELHNPGTAFYILNNQYGRPEAPIYRSDSLEQRALALCAAIQDTYRLELQFTRPLEKPTRLHLDFVDERGKALHNVVVLSQEFVYPDAGKHP